MRKISFTKLNNSRIILALLLLAVFAVFLALGLTLITQPYFYNLPYVGHYYGTEYNYQRRLTIEFEKYGRCRATSKSSYDGQQPSYSESTGTYEFVDWYDKPYFEITDSWSNIYYTNAFKLEYSGIVFTNISAICLLVFYLLMSVGTLTCAIVLLTRHKNGKPVFGNILRLQAQIDELQKQVDELKNDEE